jgi:hypothetical protein
MDHQDPSPQRRPPGPGGADEARTARRDRGLRHVRRLSNWTAAVLVGATAITAGYFARAGAGAPRPAGPQAAVAAGAAQGSHQPCVSAPVATSGGSGVTATKVPSSCATVPNRSNPPVVPVYSHGEADQ